MIKPCEICRSCPYSPCNIYPPDKVNNRVPPKMNPVTVTTKTTSYDEKYIDAVLRIPVLKSGSYGVVINKINKDIENDITEFNLQMQQAAKAYAKEAQEKGTKFISYIISTVYQVNYNMNDIISITIIYYEYVGGTNNFIKASYNYNLNTGKSLSLKDLFINNVDYKEILNKLIKEQLTQEADKYFPQTMENFKGIAEDQPFYITNDGIDIYFGFHQIAPLESKIPIIKIPYSKLQGMLKSDIFRYNNL